MPGDELRLRLNSSAYANLANADAGTLAVVRGILQLDVACFHVHREYAVDHHFNIDSIDSILEFSRYMSFTGRRG